MSEQTDAGIERQIKVYQSTGALPKRIADLRATLAKGPGDVASWTLLARFLEADQKQADAVQAIQKAVQLDPSSVPAWLTTAMTSTIALPTSVSPLR